MFAKNQCSELDKALGMNTALRAKVAASSLLQIMLLHIHTCMQKKCQVSFRQCLSV